MARDGIDLSLAMWRKSSRSNNGRDCVQVASNLPDVVALRHSKDPDGPVLVFTLAEWAAFVGGVRDGEFDQS